MRHFRFAFVKYARAETRSREEIRALLKHVSEQHEKILSISNNWCKLKFHISVTTQMKIKLCLIFKFYLFSFISFFQPDTFSTSAVFKRSDDQYVKTFHGKFKINKVFSEIYRERFILILFYFILDSYC